MNLAPPCPAGAERPFADAGRRRERPMGRPEPDDDAAMLSYCRERANRGVSQAVRAFMGLWRARCRRTFTRRDKITMTATVAK